MKKLLSALNADEEADRIYAVQDICGTNDPAFAKPLLERLAKETSEAVREAIVFCLKDMDVSGQFTLLFNLFRSEDAYLRNAAVNIFGSRGEEAIGFLTAYMDHSDREVRKLILDALYNVGTLEAALAIRASLHDSSINVRITAVEYLARLEDKESVDEMLDLLKTETEPMLITTILESLPKVGDEANTVEALAVLKSGSDITKVDPLYLPEAIRLVARSGDVQTFCRMINSVPDEKIYAENILGGIAEAAKRFAGILEQNDLKKKIRQLAESNEMDPEIRFIAVDLLLAEKALTPEERFELGAYLADDEDMLYGAVRLLMESGLPKADKKVSRILEETKDEELKALVKGWME